MPEILTNVKQEFPQPLQVAGWIAIIIWMFWFFLIFKRTLVLSSGIWYNIISRNKKGADYIERNGSSCTFSFSSLLSSHNGGKVSSESDWWPDFWPGKGYFRVYQVGSNKSVSVTGVNPPPDIRSAWMRRDSVRKMSAEADPNPAPRSVSGSWIPGQWSGRKFHFWI